MRSADSMLRARRLGIRSKDFDFFGVSVPATLCRWCCPKTGRARSVGFLQVSPLGAIVICCCQDGGVVGFPLGQLAYIARPPGPSFWRLELAAAGAARAAAGAVVAGLVAFHDAVAAVRT